MLFLPNSCIIVTCIVGAAHHGINLNSSDANKIRSSSEFSVDCIQQIHHALHMAVPVVKYGQNIVQIVDTQGHVGGKPRESMYFLDSWRACSSSGQHLQFVPFNYSIPTACTINAKCTQAVLSATPSAHAHSWLLWLGPAGSSAQQQRHEPEGLWPPQHSGPVPTGGAQPSRNLQGGCREGWIHCTRW